jgi:kynureninase
MSPGEMIAHAASRAMKLDAEDPLAALQKEFIFPVDSSGQPYHYFCGNSLGLQPKRAISYVQEEMNAWGRYGVLGHAEKNDGWMDYSELVVPPLARVVGAKPSEVVAMGSLTANLHLLMVSFYRPQGVRRRILIEQGAFSSDRYAVMSQIAFHGGHHEADLVEVAPRPGESTLRTDDLLATIEAQGEALALILLGGVNYLTGQAFDLKAVAAAGRRIGAVVGYDLAHAAGNIELHLHDWQVDFAAWCTYKYLNAGPGAIAGLFVHERHSGQDLPRFHGWWGTQKTDRFAMRPEFAAHDGAAAWQLSNPPILQLAALRGSLELFDLAGMVALIEKSKRLTAFFTELLSLGGDSRREFEVITPTSGRGCQWSLRALKDPESLQRRLLEQGIVADFRRPDIIRVSPVPLYNRFDEIVALVTALRGW